MINTVNEKQLNNKKVLITGGARRLGGRLARALARDGAEILLHYNRSIEDAKSLQQQIESENGRCHLFQADLLDSNARKALCNLIDEKQLIPDILINSASIFPEQSIWDFKDEELIENMTLHVIAARDFSALLKDKTEGIIINMLDCRIQDYDSRHLPYHFSKKTLFQLTRVLAEEMAPQIRVNAIAPGLILPPEGQGEEYMDKMKHSNLLKRSGSAEDIVSAARFLIHSPFVTGQVLYIDGGRHMKGSFYG